MAAAKGSADSRTGQLLGDLIQMVLYFYLLSCEYTKTNSHNQTTQFHLRNMQIRYAWVVFPFESLAQNLRQVVVVYLFGGENPYPWKQPA